MGNDTTYIFIVDTEQYAGNFARELCGYMTGRVGECEVGDAEAKIFNREMGTAEDALDDDQHPFQFVVEEPDEHGCLRPSTSWDTPGWFNHGMGNVFRNGQEAEAEEDHRRECHKYADEMHDESCRQLAGESLHKWPAHLSAAIFMERQPTEAERDLLMRRALAFPAYWKQEAEWNDEIIITGFRLLRRDTTYTETWTRVEEKR